MNTFRNLLGILNSQKKTFEQISQKIGNISPDSVAKTNEELAGIEIIPEYTQVTELIESQNKIILVTGGAGTGKSTLIKWLQTLYSGQIVVLAPTGIAALTIGGSTIHRLCKFPPTFIVDADVKKDSRTVICKTNIVVIDEISMVNANLLDAFNKYCQINRENDEPFGGLTVVMVGDLFQLPPVVTNVTKALFEKEYWSEKFFAAKCLEKTSLTGIELVKPFRQSDEHFVGILNKIREGVDLSNTVRLLNESCVVREDAPDGAVHLAPRNVDVDAVNNAKLQKLRTPDAVYEGVVVGRFTENPPPVPWTLVLRVGAQVVFRDNSSKWVNGTIGSVVETGEHFVKVRLQNNKEVVQVGRSTWTQYEFSFDEDSAAVVRKEVGKFTQFPLILAWAMTIHKSQGLTLDKAHVDFGVRTFADGQAYVALSRVRTLNSMTLARDIRTSDVKVDAEAVSFYREIRG